MPDGFSFEEAMRPVETKGFSFAEALAKPNEAPAPVTATDVPPGSFSRGADMMNQSVPAKSFAAPVGGEFGDLSAQPWAQGEQPADNARAPAAKIADAAVQGWRDTEPVLTDKAKELLDKYTYPDLATAVKFAGWAATNGIAAVRGGMAGVSQAAMELLGEKGGRDFNALVASAPMAAHEIPPTPGPRTMVLDQAVRDANPANWRAFEGVGGEPPLTAPYKPITMREIMADNPGMSAEAAYAQMSAQNRAGFSRAMVRRDNPVETVAPVLGAESVDDAIAKANEVIEGPRPVPPENEPLHTVNAQEDQATELARQVPTSSEPGATQRPPPRQVGDETMPGKTAFDPVKQPLRLNSFLARDYTIGRPGDVNSQVRPGGLVDTGGDVSAIVGGPKGRPGLLNGRGTTLDDATMRAWEGGYFPEASERPSINDLLDKIDEDHNGNPVYSMHDQDAVDAYHYALESNSEISRLSDETGISPLGRTKQQFFDAVSNHYSLEELAREQAFIAWTHETALDAMNREAQASGIDLQDFYDTVAPPRSLRDLENEFRQENAARPAHAGESGGQQPGLPTEGSTTGQAGNGSVGGTLNATGNNVTPGTRIAQPPLDLGPPPIRSEPPSITPLARDPATQSVGAAASREQTPASQLAIPPDEAAAIRQQGEIERFAAPPAMNDTRLHVPRTKLTLAEGTGDPQAAMDQAYNKQQRETMQEHVKRENHNADTVATYYADTAESKPQLGRLERDRDARAKANIQEVFGDPQSERAPADTTPTRDLVQGILDNPRQAERESVINVLTKLKNKFYDNGVPKSDPYALYGIGEHINDLLNGVGNIEESSAARVLKRELTQIKESLYDDIEMAAPGFAKYRAEYQADSAAISALKYLQDERLALLNKDMHITPAKWFSFMKRIIEGRADPLDPAASLSEAQMDRLWNITDHLKRQTFIDAGKPRGSWTSMMQEWGGRFTRAAAHLAVLPYAPAVGNIGIEMGIAAMRKRSVYKEMQRVLHPDFGQPPTP